DVSAAVLLLLKGDSVQRALAAWSAGWLPALEVSGSDWLPPLLAPLLEDSSPVIRLMASRSLEMIDDRDKIDYDFVASAAQLAKARRKVTALWGELPLARRLSLPQRVLVKADGTLDHRRIEQLLGQRDQRELRVRE